MINKNLKVKILEIRGSWESVYRACLNTVGKERLDTMPSETWKRKIILSEHSPIRKLSIGAKFYDLFYWVCGHFVRHKIGVEHFVSTQRQDRTGVDRGKNPQESPVDYELDANIQALITMSRKRCCYQASPETREAWNLFLNELKETEPEIVACCVKECVYRNGLCPEFRCCGYNKSKQFEEELKEYTKFVTEQINPKTNIHLK